MGKWAYFYLSEGAKLSEASRIGSEKSKYKGPELRHCLSMSQALYFTVRQ